MAFNTTKIKSCRHLILWPAECTQTYKLAHYEKKVGHPWNKPSNPVLFVSKLD